MRDPSVTVTAKGLYFDKTAIKTLDMAVYVDIRFDPAAKVLIVYPSCVQDERHIRWAVEKEGSICPMHIAWDTASCFDTMGWNNQWRYRSIGTPGDDDGRECLIFLLEYSMTYVPETLRMRSAAKQIRMVTSEVE